MKKIMGRAMLLAGIALSLLFAFDVKTHVVYAITDDDAVAVDDDPAPAEDDDAITDDDVDNDENTNGNEDDDDEETTAQAQKGEEVADNVKMTDADDDNESNTVKYVANASDDQMDKNASTQAKEVSKDPNVMKTKPMTDYTMSDSNSCWVPYWYWFVIMNNHSSSDMPKKHPANVKTSKENVKKYQHYVNDKAGDQAFSEFFSIGKTILKILVLLTSGVIVLGMLVSIYGKCKEIHDQHE